MVYKLIVDTREPSELKQELSVEERALPVGDFWIESEDGKIHILIERKTISDLISSIKDGRFREQRQRALQIDGIQKIIYIIEGLLPLSHTRDERMVMGALENLILHHNIYVLNTRNIEQTIIVLQSILKKASISPVQNNNIQLPPQSKSQVSREIPILVSMLCSIPRVSVNIAQSIYEKYPTLKQLCNASISDIAAIKIGQRKIGPVLAKRIVDAIG